MSIRMKGAIAVGTLLNISVGLIGVLSLMVYNNLTSRVDKAEARLDKQESAITNVANNVYLLCVSSKNTNCIKPDSPIK